MQGKVAVIICKCGRCIDIDEYELMSISLGEGQKVDDQPIVKHCDGCDNDVTVELSVRVISQSK